jgi:UPF0042 nucleotide-binding protein
MAEYLIITGMSGAGRSSAAATLEDLGWFVIDNLPPALIGKVAELSDQAGSEYQRVCFVVGRGGSEAVGELRPEIERLSAAARVRVLFLDASDEVLVRRFEGTRRRHPLGAAGVLDAIRQERALLEELRDGADVVLDTSDLNVHELHDRLVELFGPSSRRGRMAVSVVSFGYKHGLPLDVDLVVDCRFLPNPHWVPELRPRTGLDEPVRNYVLASAEAGELLERLDHLLELVVPASEREGKAYLRIAVGCTGGRHRSVVIAEEIAARLAARGYAPSVYHRDVER